MYQISIDIAILLPAAYSVRSNCVVSLCDVHCTKQLEGNSMCCITLVEQTKVEAARTMEFQLDLVIIMLDPGRHGGRWLMTLLDPRGDIHPEGFASLFFHLRDTELLVTAFPGCRTRFFLAITTCHATFPRVSVSLCFYFLLLLTTTYRCFRLFLIPLYSNL